MPVLVIALDGATFDVLNPWLADGSLPTLARLMAAGTSGTLASTLPPLSAPAWASFMTGKNPGGHGVFDFFRQDVPDLDRHEMVNSTDIRAAMLWEISSQNGSSGSARWEPRRVMFRSRSCHLHNPSHGPIAIAKSRRRSIAGSRGSAFRCWRPWRRESPY